MSEFNPKCPEAINLLLNRRSGKARRLVEPGPDRDQTERMLEAARRVPDHGKLAPWRFLVLEKEGQKALAGVIAQAYDREEDSPNDHQRESLIEFPTQAPLLIVTVSSPSDARPIPEWEQWLSAGAACQNLLLAAHSLGFVGNWLTGWAAYSRSVQQALELGPKDRIAGFIFIGSYNDPMQERPRPYRDEVVRYWTGAD